MYPLLLSVRLWNPARWACVNQTCAYMNTLWDCYKWSPRKRSFWMTLEWIWNQPTRWGWELSRFETCTLNHDHWTTGEIRQSYEFPLRSLCLTYVNIQLAPDWNIEKNLNFLTCVTVISLLPTRFLSFWCKLLFSNPLGFPMVMSLYSLLLLSLFFSSLSTYNPVISWAFFWLGSISLCRSNLSGSSDAFQVLNPQQAIQDLQNELGFCVQGFYEGTSVVPKRLIIPVDKLKQYLDTQLGLHSEGEYILSMNSSFDALTASAYTLSGTNDPKEVYASADYYVVVLVVLVASQVVCVNLGNFPLRNCGCAWITMNSQFILAFKNSYWVTFSWIRWKPELLKWRSVGSALLHMYLTWNSGLKGWVLALHGNLLCPLNLLIFFLTVCAISLPINFPHFHFHLLHFPILIHVYPASHESDDPRI